MDELDQELHSALGRKVKSLRLHRRLTIEQLGRRADVSKSMLSMIEAGRRAPSIRLLLRLAKSLTVSVTELLEDVQNAKPPIVVRRTERKKESLSKELATGYVYHLAEMTWSNLFLRVYEYHLSDLPETPVSFQHPGFLILLVVSGSIEMRVNGKHHRLSAGDTIGCDAGIPHAWVKIEQGPVNMLGLQAWAHDA